MLNICAICWSHFYFNRKYTKILNELVYIDKCLKEFGIILEYNVVRNYSAGIFFLEVICYLIHILTKISRAKDNDDYYVLFYFLHFMYICITMINFLHFMVFIQIFIQRFLALNRCLKKLILCGMVGSDNRYLSILNSVRKIAIIHKRLSLVVHSVNDIYSIQMITYTIAVFFVVLSNIYSIICSVILNQERLEENFQYSIFRCVYFTYKIVIITCLCNKLKNYVSIVVVNVCIMVRNKTCIMEFFFLFHVIKKHDYIHKSGFIFNLIFVANL